MVATLGCFGLLYDTYHIGLTHNQVIIVPIRLHFADQKMGPKRVRLSNSPVKNYISGL